MLQEDTSTKMKNKFRNQYSRAFSVSPSTFETVKVTNRKRLNSYVYVCLILL
jgi:hypothetical protein